jgi:hypothetical protein
MSDERNDLPRLADAGTDTPSDDRVVDERMQRPETPADVARQAETGTVRETLYKLPGSREQVPATEATQAELRSITATTVLMDRSGAESITADRVQLERSGSKSIDTKSAQLDRSGVVALGSEHTVLLHSSAVQVVAEEARVTDSTVVWLTTERASLENSLVILFAGTAEGDVQPVFTPQTAAIFGAAAGGLLALLSLVLRGRSRRG